MLKVSDTLWLLRSGFTSVLVVFAVLGAIGCYQRRHLSRGLSVAAGGFAFEAILALGDVLGLFESHRLLEPDSVSLFVYYVGPVVIALAHATAIALIATGTLRALRDIQGRIRHPNGPDGVDRYELPPTTVNAPWQTGKEGSRDIQP
jgi:hypothetical protein